MTENSQKRIKLCCYAAVEEKELVDQLHHSIREAFSPLTVSWEATLLSPAMEWKQEEKQQLEDVTLILWLVSPAFLHIGYTFWLGMQHALGTYKTHTIRLLPILLRPIDQDLAFFKISPVLPTNGEPVTIWPSCDHAFKDIANGLKDVTKEMLVSQWREQGDMLFSHKCFADALSAFEEALLLDSNNANLYGKKGEVLSSLDRHEAALEAYEQALLRHCGDPNFQEMSFPISNAMKKLSQPMSKPSRLLLREHCSTVIRAPLSLPCVVMRKHW